MSIGTVNVEEDRELEYECVPEEYTRGRRICKTNRERKSKPIAERRNTRKPQYAEQVTFLLRIPKEIWIKFIKTVPISRTRHDFILDLIQRRIWEYEKATQSVRNYP